MKRDPAIAAGAKSIFRIIICSDEGPIAHQLRRLSYAGARKVSRNQKRDHADTLSARAHPTNEQYLQLDEIAAGKAANDRIEAPKAKARQAA